MAVGRISGPLLKDNLLRNGQNLAFETSLLYLDVVNSRIGVNTTSPAYDLDVNGTTRSNNLYVTTQANLATFTVSGNTISSSSNTITFSPSGGNATIFSGTLAVSNLSLTTNSISATGTNMSVNINTTGTGVINLNSNTLVTGNLHATGNITADGNIALGNQTTDTVSFTGEVNSNILPSATNTYNLGSSSLQWNNLYVNTANIANVTIGTLNATDIKTANLDISGNTISSINANSDINFATTGTGGILFGNFRFYNNTITNIVSNAVSQFTETNNGYVKIAGTYGVVIPNGATATRPNISYTEVGMIRFNTDLLLVEVYTGAGWASAAGTSVGVTSSTAQDIAVAAALAFG
jgi:hypothetical protein